MSLISTQISLTLHMAANSIRFLVCFIVFGVSVGPFPALGQAEDPPVAQESPSSPEAETSEEDKTPIFNREEQLFLLYAWYLVFSNRIDMIELSDKEKQAFLVGINLGLQQRSLTGWEDVHTHVSRFSALPIFTLFRVVSISYELHLIPPI